MTNFTWKPPRSIMALAILSATGTAIAEQKTHHLSIAPQSISDALKALAAETHIQIFSDGEALKGKKTNGIQGDFSAKEALQKLLTGTGLTYTFTSDDAVAVKEALTGSDAVSTLPAVRVVGKTVNDLNAENYSVSDSATATKTDTPLLYTPISVQSVTRTVMDDQQVVKLDDAIKNVSGVQRSGSFGDEGGLYDNFVIRGFDTQFSNFRNGIRQQSFSFEPANVQQVDVLKGPAAILYGRIEPGGMINLVTRQPEAERHFSVQQQFGSFDFYRTTIDATGPINDDKSLLYRLDLAYLDKGSFRDYGGKERIFLAPSVTWNISDYTQINLNLEYQHDNQVDDPGIPALNGSNRPAPVPLSRFYGEPDFRTKQDRKLVELAWSHAFNKDWSLRQRFQASLADYDSNNVWTAFVDDDNRTFQRGYWRVKQERDTYGLNQDLLGHFETFGIKHTTLVGMDFFRLEQNSYGFSDGFGFDINGDVHVSAPPIDLYNPVYGQAVTPEGNDLYFTNRQNWVGFYFQDQMNFFDKVHFLFGGRHDWATSGNGGSGSAWNAEPGGSLAEADLDYKNNRVDAEKFTPRLGLVYTPIQELSFYANYVESFGLSNGRTRGQPLPAQTARQYEGGIKTELWDGRFTSTLAFFQIYKDNIATPDLEHPGLRRAVGEARSSGIELDASGRITDDLSLVANYALTDTAVTKDNSGNLGHGLPNVGKHSGNVWMKYLFHGGDMQGLSFGTGVYLISQRQANIENDLQLPGYVRWDASVGYQFKVGDTKLSTQLNAYNLLNKQYYSANDWMDVNFSPRTNIVPGAPLTLMGSVKVEF